MDARRKGQPRRGYALVVPGIEDVASSELADADAHVDELLTVADKRENIVLFSTRDFAPLLSLGTIENVFLLVSSASTPRHGRPLRELTQRLDKEVFEDALLVHHSLRERRRGRSYKVVVRVSGRHPFRRDELQRAFERVIGRWFPRWVLSSTAAAVEVWVQVAGDRTLVGLRLSSDVMAKRAYKRAHFAASLKPTVARALVLLTNPRHGEVFVDPMCGAGTIVRERPEVSAPRVSIGGDRSGEAVAAARVNVGRAGWLALWDAGSLPLRDGSVDAIAVNPPYGRQHENVRDLRRLYTALFSEIARVLRPGGRCVAMAADTRALESSLPDALVIRERRRVIVRGLTVSVFVLGRQATDASRRRMTSRSSRT